MSQCYSLTASIWLALCLISAAQAEAVLRRGNAFEPATLDPHRYTSVYESFIIHDLFEGLVTVDPGGQLVPGVADFWSVSDDGRTYTFSLRSGLKWSDGAPLTSEDVVFTFQRLMNPATAAQYSTLFYVLENGEKVHLGVSSPSSLGVTVLDDLTVQFRLLYPAPYFLQLLSNAFAAVVPRHMIEAVGKDWVKPGVMVGNGAFGLQEWRPHDRIELVRNTNYRLATDVWFDRVVYFPTADSNNAFTRFRARELDMNLSFPTSRVEWLRDNMPAEIRTSMSLLTYYVALNTMEPDLADRRVRRALSMAIDREVIATKILRTGEMPAYSFVPPSVQGYKTSEMNFQSLSMAQRRAAARNLLVSAGYGPEEPLSFKFSYSSTEERRRIAVAIAAMWNAVGVQAVLENLEGRVLFRKLRDGAFEAGFSSWVADYNDAENFLYVLRSDTQNSNYSRYANPDFDALLDQAATVNHPLRRAKLLQQAEAMAMTDHPLLPLYFGVNKNLVHTYVNGWEENPRDIHLSRYLVIDHP